MKNKNLIYILIALLYLGGSGYLLYTMIGDVGDFMENRIEYTKRASAENGAGEIYQWIPLMSDWGELVAEGEVFKNRSDRHYEQIQFFALLYVGISSIFIMLTLLMFRTTKVLWKYLSMTLLLISTLCLFVGISTPMMEFDVYVENFKLSGLELNSFEGKMHLIYQVKTILGLIKILFAENNFLVGIAILLFSVVLPITKLVLSVLQLFSEKVANNKVANFITNYLGKWSMADVFVVAILLGFFAVVSMGAQGIETHTAVLVGLYYFTAYCIVSLITTYFIKAAIKSKEQSQVIENAPEALS